MSGNFEFNASGVTGVWHKQVVFAAIGGHDMSDGDAYNKSMMDVGY